MLRRVAIATTALWIGAATAAQAEPLRWGGELGRCYDSAHEEKRAIVVMYYDGETGRAEAEALIRQLSLSPKMQALSGVTVWCRADVRSGRIEKNFGRALGVTAFPSISILRPEWSRIWEDMRIIPKGVPEAAVEAKIDESVRRVRAAVPPPWQPPKRY